MAVKISSECLFGIFTERHISVVLSYCEPNSTIKQKFTVTFTEEMKP